MTTGQQFSSVAAVVILSLLAVVMPWSCGRFPAVLTNQIRDAILVPVVFGMLGLAFLVLPLFNFTDGERAVVSLWAFAPGGILMGWAWGFATAARKKVLKIIA